MLNEVKHLGREGEVGIAPEERTMAGSLSSAQDDKRRMTSDGATERNRHALRCSAKGRRNWRSSRAQNACSRRSRREMRRPTLRCPECSRSSLYVGEPL